MTPSNEKPSAQPAAQRVKVPEAVTAGTPATGDPSALKEAMKSATRGDSPQQTALDNPNAMKGLEARGAERQNDAGN